MRLLNGGREVVAVVSGVGAARPARVIRNSHFAYLGISDQWITSRTGIEERRWLGPGEGLTGLAVEASTLALVDAECAPEDIDLVIAATATSDRVSPGLAPELACGLGLRDVPAVDLNAACTGFLYALDQAVAQIDSGRRRCVLVCGADAASRIIDPDDRFTAPLFGDAAGAVVVRAADAERSCATCAPAVVLGADGSLGDILYVDRERHTVHMEGAEVYERAVDAMADSARRVCALRGAALEDIDLFVPHQANARIIKSVLRRLEFPAERTVVYVGAFGNTSASSIPLSLHRAQLDGRLPRGTRVGMAAFGAGLTWAAALLDWKGCRHTPPGQAP